MNHPALSAALSRLEELAAPGPVRRLCIQILKRPPRILHVCVSTCVRNPQVTVCVLQREVNLPVIPKSSGSLRGIKVRLQRLNRHISHSGNKLVWAGRQIDRLGGGR